MKDKTVNYGLIGFGGIAENRIVKEGFALDRLRFNESVPMKLYGATDINPRRKAAAEAMGIRWFETTDTLLESDRIDAVVVATSNSTHFEVARKALEAGKHVMIEKPIATTMEDAGELCRLAVEKGLSLDVDHMMTRNAYNIKCRDLVADGSLGSIDHIVLHMEILYGSTPEEAATWRCSNPEEFGGPIGDVGTQCFYVAEFLLGQRIETLSCVYTPPTLDIADESGALIRFATADGVSGTARVAFDQSRGGVESTLLNLGYEIYGTEGTIRNQGSLFQLSGHPDEIIRQSKEEEHGQISKIHQINDIQNIYQTQITSHARSIQETHPLEGFAAVHNLAMVLACHESAIDGGSPQKIPGKEV
jgi:predicted dehydrogenase